MAGSTGDRLQAGILAARQGQNQEAKELLASVVAADPNSELAWLWLGKVLTSADQCAECFRRALAINPENKEAHQLLMDMIRPDLSFMPKTPAARPGVPTPSQTPSQIFTPETKDFPAPPAVMVGEENKADPAAVLGASPLAVDPVQPDAVAATGAFFAEPATPASQTAYVPPFDEPIGNAVEELSLEDRAALAAEADQRVLGKSLEPGPVPGMSPAAPAIAEKLRPPFPGFVEPAQPPRSAAGWIFAVSGFLLALFLLGLPAFLLSKDGAAISSLANFIQPSQPVSQAVIVKLPTAVPSSTPRASPTPRAVPSFTPEPPQSFAHRLESVHAEILRGQNLIQSNQYAEAVLVWNNVLAVVPEDGDSHYRRGVAYLDLAELPPRRLDEYKGYLDLAHSDLDQAIAIGPVQGEYFLARHRDLMDLAMLEADRSQRSSLLESALADAKNALQLGILFEKGLDRRPANAMLAMDQCDRSLNSLLALKAPGKMELVDEVGTHIDLARAYLCTGNVDLAMDQVLEAEKFGPADRIYWIKALTLYNKGLLNETLALLDDWIKRKPYVSSPRYTLRALVHYDLGQIENAGADLVAAENEGFDSTGLGIYVTARLAIDAGNLPTGVDLMAQADTYVPPDFGLIARRIHQDYHRLKGQPTPSVPAP